MGGVLGGVRFEPGADGLRAAVLSVGSELLLGDITDSNATWLSLRLRELGVEVIHHLAVRDALDEFVDALGWLRDRVDMVIVGGGLGPTVDDLTREAVAAAAGVQLEHRDDLETAIVERFTSMRRAMAPQNLRQARVPAGADAYPPVGTAPGFGLTMPEPTPTRVVALPGVPWEMRELFARHVVTEIRELVGTRATVTRVLHVVGMGESDIAAAVEPHVEGRRDVVLSFLAKSAEVQVRLTVSGTEPAEARAASQPLVDELVEVLAGAVVGVDDDTLEAVVLRELVARGASVATAESATSGDIAARLGRVPGASRAFTGGAVVYSRETKCALLGLSDDDLRGGEVGEEVTRALASAVQHRTGADWAVAVTGVAGPDPVGDLAIGQGYWALAHPDGRVEVHGRVLPGDREQVIARLGSAVLDLLRRRLGEVAP